MSTQLTAHPRLYISADAIASLATPPTPPPPQTSQSPRLEAASQRLAHMAKSFVKSPVFDWKINTHNAHLVRARRMQGRVVTLIAEFFRTGHPRFKAAAVAHLLEIGQWEYWSWITWRQKNADPNAIYDLSYGENNATLALGFDLLYDHLSEDDRQAIVNVAKRGADSFLTHTRDRTAGWFRQPTSNWNTVCAGGGGMLALAMYEYLPESQLMLDRAEESFIPFMDELVRTNGGWVEGIGYWNYGMRYAFMYLLSHQRATASKHPLLHRKATRQTLQFPLDFTPHGHGCSFGDVNHWSPLPFHYAVAMALGEQHIVPELDRRLDSAPANKTDFDSESWPTTAELLLLHPDNGSWATKSAASSPKSKPKATATATASRSATQTTPAEAAAPEAAPVARIYQGLDWAVLADRQVDPSLYAAIRAGSSSVPHAHQDLSSFHLVAHGQHFIQNLGPSEYLDTTFSPRRWELFEMAPSSKNVLLINGVGFRHPAEVPIKPVKHADARGFRLDLSASMGEMRDGPAVSFYARLFLLISDQALLVVDRVRMSNVARLEQRMFTPAEITSHKAGVSLAIAGQKLGVAMASNVKSRIFQGSALLTTPTDTPPTALRHVTTELVSEATLVTAFTLNDPKPRIAVEADPAKVVLTLQSKSLNITLDLTTQLRPPKTPPASAPLR